MIYDPAWNRMAAPSRFALTEHARIRLDSRRISYDAVLAALQFGREVRIPGGTVYFVGRRQVHKQAAQGRNISSFEGIQVLCSLDGAIITAFRNHDLRWLRLRSREPRRPRNWAGRRRGTVG